MLKPPKTKILLTQSIQEKYRHVLQELPNVWNFDIYWLPFISLQKCPKIPSAIHTQDIFISSTKTLEFLDISLLDGKDIHVVGEKTADKIQQMGMGRVREIYKSAAEAKFPRSCTFIGATQPTKIVQEKIASGELIHFPLYDRVEHRHHTIPKDIEWVAFLSPSAVMIWFETYCCTQHSNIKYAVIGETTNHQLKVYQIEATVMPPKPNFQLLLEEIAQSI